MTPGIDGDILAYELGFAAEAGWQHPGFPSFDYVQELLHNRIGNICAVAEATKPPVIFLTGKKNFRYHIAKRKPYKTRAGNKPFHYYNIKAYLKAVHEYEMKEGLEADDLLAIRQFSDQDGFISCTRDKDARTVEGWVYSWELGNQPAFGPHKIVNPGTLDLVVSGKTKKIKGTGDLFFYAQCLMGDDVDSILGLGNGYGVVKTFKTLDGCTDTKEALTRVREAYNSVYGASGDYELLEQARLLHMTRRFENNKALLWGFPEDNFEEWIDVDTGEIKRTPKVLSDDRVVL
jgi:hypothetical protein